MRARRFIASVITGAAVGCIVITIYLVAERAVADRLPVTLCLQQLLQWDASNAYGARAFGGGWPTALIGLAMDYVVSLGWALLFTALYFTTPFMRRQVAISGLAFGAIVMVVMLFGIVPLGRAVQLEATPSHIVNVLIAHTVFFGLPLAVTVSRLA